MNESASTRERERQGNSKRNGTMGNDRAGGGVEGPDHIDRSGAENSSYELEYAVERERDAATGCRTKHFPNDRQGGESVKYVCAHFLL